MKGSRKMSTSASESAVGPSHQRQAANIFRGSDTSVLLVTIIVVRAEVFDQVRVERVFRSLDHRQAIAALIVFDLVHDVVDEEHAAPGRFEEVGRVARVWNLLDVKSVALIFDR